MNRIKKCAIMEVSGIQEGKKNKALLSRKDVI